ESAQPQGLSITADPRRRGERGAESNADADAEAEDVNPHGAEGLSWVEVFTKEEIRHGERSGIARRRVRVRHSRWHCRFCSVVSGRSATHAARVAEGVVGSAFAAG